MIFVTGGTGLLGSHILFDLAKQGKPVRALKRSGSDISAVRKVFGYYAGNAEELFNKISWVDGDVLDIHSLLDNLDGCDSMIHAAAFVSFNPRKRDLVHKINVEGTANCVNAALEKNIKRFCYISSVGAIGPAKKGETITEKQKWSDSDNVSVYALTKYLGEREVWRGIAEGLNAFIVNPSIMIGPGNRSSAQLIQKVWEGLKFYTPGITGFVDVRDVARATIALLDSNISRKRFITSAENVSFKQLFDWIAEALNKPKPNIKATKFLSEIYWRVQWLKGLLTNTEPLITRESAHTANRTRIYSNQKIKAALGFEFIPVHQSIKEICEIFLREV